MLGKLKSEAGESLPEVLVAALVIALGMMLFAGMTSSSFRIVKKSENAFREYVEARNTLEETNPDKGAPDGSVTLIYGEGAQTYANAVPGQKLTVPVAWTEAEGGGFRLVRYAKAGEDEG